MTLLSMWQHSVAVVSTVPSQQKDPGIKSQLGQGV